MATEKKKKKKRREYIEDALTPLLGSISLVILLYANQSGLPPAVFFAALVTVSVAIFVLGLIALGSAFRFGWSLALKAWRSPFKGKFAAVYFIGLVLVLAVGVLGILPWTFVSPAALALLTFALTELKEFSRSRTPPVSAKQEPPPKRTATTDSVHIVCDVGPYKVEAGESRSILLNVKQGQKVKGHLVEVDSQPFDWYIADEKNMILLMNGLRDEFTYIEWGLDERAYRVNRKIPYPARWYLILDTYGKRYGRKVRVDFESVPDRNT